MMIRSLLLVVKVRASGTVSLPLSLSQVSPDGLGQAASSTVCMVTWLLVVARYLATTETTSPTCVFFSLPLASYICLLAPSLLANSTNNKYHQLVQTDGVIQSATCQTQRLITLHIGMCNTNTLFNMACRNVCFAHTL
jgi:hypothetical protein